MAKEGGYYEMGLDISQISFLFSWVGGRGVLNTWNKLKKFSKNGSYHQPHPLLFTIIYRRVLILHVFILSEIRFHVWFINIYWGLKIIFNNILLIIKPKYLQERKSYLYNIFPKIWIVYEMLPILDLTQIGTYSKKKL